MVQVWIDATLHVQSPFERETAILHLHGCCTPAHVSVRRLYPASPDVCSPLRRERGRGAYLTQAALLFLALRIVIATNRTQKGIRR